MNKNSTVKKIIRIKTMDSPAFIASGNSESDEIESRRNILRGIVAAACGLFVPATLFGSSHARADTAAPPAANKVPPASVQYQSKPKGELKCSECVNFIAASNTCKRVAGKVSPNGWCSLWTKKA